MYRLRMEEQLSKFPKGCKTGAWASDSACIEAMTMRAITFCFK